MAADASALRSVPLFSLLDDEERAVLFSQVETRRFTPGQRIYRQGESSARAYVVVEGKVRVTTIDEDEQELLIDEPEQGGFFGFASLLDGTPHQTTAESIGQCVCVEIDREDLSALIRNKPDAAMDMLAVLGRQFHSAQMLARSRSVRNPNEIIEQRATFGDHLADAVAGFGGSWKFIILFAAILIAYTAANQVLGRTAWDPYPYILLNLFLSMLAAIQAPVIMMSQNRQDTKDRLRGELDFEVNRRAEREIREISRRLNELGTKVSDIYDGLVEEKPGQ